MNTQDKIEQLDVEIEAVEHAINGSLATSEYDELVQAVIKLQEKRSIKRSTLINSNNFLFLTFECL